jgi:hypothetical protein
MYCTISQRSLSTNLRDDAASAYYRFRQKARTLGTISRSLDTLALSVTAAYLAALSDPAPGAWTTLVARTALLVQRTKALDGIVVLDAQEREALEFFAAIVHENADVLEVPSAAAGANFEPLRFHISVYS